MQTDLLVFQDQNEVFSTGIKSEKGKGDNISKALESDDMSEGKDTDFLSALIGITESRVQGSGVRGQNSESKTESAEESERLDLRLQSPELRVESSMLNAETLESRVQGSGFRGQRSGVKAENSGLKTQSLDLKVEISELKTQGLELKAESPDTNEVTRISTSIKETEGSQVPNQKAKEAESSGFRVQGSEVKAETSQPEAQRLNSNHQEAGEVVKNLIKNQASYEATPKIESNFQDIKTIAKNMENFDKNFSHKEPDNVLLFPESRSSDRVSDTGLHAKETQLIQKPLQTEILTQIVKKASFNLKNGQTEVKIDLKPEFLGHIQLKISTENHQVMVRMLTEIPLVKDMIENNINQLKADLQNHGLEIDKFDVFFSRDSDQHENGHENGEFLKKNGETGEGEADGILAKEMEEEAQFAHERTGANLIGVFA
jgi:flagellar hook-length control protein FliK